MELVMDFDFNSARNSPYPTAPSTPRRFGEYYYSAPPSPSRLVEFYSEFDDFYDHIDIAIGHDGSVSPKGYSRNEEEEDHDHFAFDFNEEMERESVSAEELFDGGMIKPLKTQELEKSDKIEPERERGRERAPIQSSSSRRASRSLSPMRSFKYSVDQEEKEPVLIQKQPSVVEKSSSSSSTSSAKGQRKWRFKDLFLFRNASEGRASDKDLLKKFRGTLRINNELPPASGGGSNSRRKGAVSAHEVLYTENRAAREGLKKKTFLPYKGVWGGLPFNPALANGFGFSHK